MSIMDKTIRPLVDLDSIVYRVGFTVKEDEDVSHSLGNVKSVLERILDEYKHPDPLLVLSGPTNFRESFCSTLPLVGPPSADGSPWKYKGNRVGARKPPHYTEIREYLKNVWGAMETDGEEADDVISSTQYEADPLTTCIVGQDKDFKGTRGLHHNWVTHKKFNVSDEDADLFFHYQVITGDRTDHIPGIKGIGEVKGAALIKKHRKQLKPLRSEIVSLYMKEFGDKWRDVIHEVSTLLFLKRERGKNYTDYFGVW